MRRLWIRALRFVLYLLSIVVWLVLGRGGATVEGVGTLAETADVLAERFNGLCEVDGGVDGGGVDAADDTEEEEKEAQLSSLTWYTRSSSKVG
jgi:hypothetical protein